MRSARCAPAPRAVLRGAVPGHAARYPQTALAPLRNRPHAITPREAKMFEIGGIVVLDPRRQNVLLPCRRRQLDSLQLLDHLQDAVAAAQLQSRSHMLPSK